MTHHRMAMSQEEFIVWCNGYGILAVTVTDNDPMAMYRWFMTSLTVNRTFLYGNTLAVSHSLLHTEQ